MKRWLVLLGLMMYGCVFQSEPKVRVIRCGDIDFDRMRGELRDTLTVKGDSCST